VRLKLTIVLCTIAVIAVVAWPRIFPRYVDAPGGAVDRWTGEVCIEWTLGDRGTGPNSDPRLCLFKDGSALEQEWASTKWTR